MLGIFDKIYAGKKKGLTHEDVDWRPTIQYDEKSSESWYCFVPKIVTRNEKIGNGILPFKGKITVYTVAYLNLIVPNIEKTLNNLREIYFDAMKRINEDVNKSKMINLMGISLGNVLSMRLADNLPEKNPKTLISLVGGGRLGLSSWNSILTQHIARNSGCNSAEEYEEKLKEFSPINYFNGLKAERVFARFGSHDLAINYNPYGKELKEALEGIEAGIKDIKTYPLADHCSTIFFSSRAGIHR